MTSRDGSHGGIPGTSRRVAPGRLLRLSAAALAIALLAVYAQAAPIGRLFFTPDRRAALERQRQLNIQEKTQEETVEVASVHLNGVVRRTGNKTTVWVNGRPQQVDNANTGILVTPSSRDMDRVNIRVGDESSTSLRVGETLNRATQEMSDGLAGGQLQVNRGDESKLRKR
ncbi:MAG: hypothetical protein D4S02_03625 [Rhodocyclaceae bacterium]|nr:MAG: hypothetical protein D4S02_03625 [Rhodocyclaceae bacterium]